MGYWGSATPKPSRILGGTFLPALVWFVDTNKFKTQEGAATATVVIADHGKDVKVTGRRSEFKATQAYTCPFGQAVCEAFKRRDRHLAFDDCGSSGDECSAPRDVWKDALLCGLAKSFKLPRNEVCF